MSIEFTFKSSIMKNRQTTILYVLLCCTCLFSCQRDNTTKLLELAEAQIWENPDSTLQILEQIPSPEKLKGKEQADYALLLTQAKYRYNILALWGAIRLSTGSITFGTMTAFLQLVGKVQRPALDLSRLLPSFINALTAVERLMELEELPSEASRTTQLFPQTPDLQLKDVTFSYSTGDRPILNHFSCNFPAGSCTAVLGETGAGKTTLIRLLLALATPQEGSITLSPANTAQPPLSTLNFQLSTLEVSPQTRSNFVYVPQGNTLFSGTIHDNLLMGNPHATEAQMLQALRTACADFVLSLPDGIDTNLNEQGGGLSEGQAQRIAIARALLRPGHILLLDEATSALDPETERQLIKNLRRDCTGKTFIFITHHPAVAEACEATIQL